MEPSDRWGAKPPTFLAHALVIVAATLLTAGCGSSSSGSKTTSGPGRPPAEGTWSKGQDIDPLYKGDPQFDGIQAVSCPTPSFCAAGGSQGMFTYDGSNWTHSDKVGDGNDVLTVSCSSPTFCVAGTFKGNVYTYTGNGWSPPQVLAGNPNGQSEVTSVSCPTNTFCAAVDGLGSLYTYNGVSWNELQDLLGTSSSGKPSVVSCPTDTFCLAGNDTYSYTYNGTRWSPLNGGTYPPLSCATSTFCVAADASGGVDRTDNGSQQGEAAQIDPMEEPVQSLSCPTTSFCAVVSNNLAATYEGTKWTRTQYIAPKNAHLESVSCPTSNFCVAGEGEGGNVYIYRR